MSANISTKRFRLAPISPTIIQDLENGRSYIFPNIDDAKSILSIIHEYERKHAAKVSKIAELEKNIEDLKSKLSTYIRIESELDICYKQLDMCREELDEYED